MQIYIFISNNNNVVDLRLLPFYCPKDNNCLSEKKQIKRRG